MHAGAQVPPMASNKRNKDGLISDIQGKGWVITTNSELICSASGYNQ